MFEFEYQINMNVIKFFSTFNGIMTHTMNPKMECKYCEMSCETYLHAHQPNYYSSLHVTLYLSKLTCSRIELLS